MIVRTIPRFLPETRGTDIMKALLWGQASGFDQEKRLKDQLIGLTGTKAAHLMPSARAGLYWLLRALQPPRLYLPAFLCSSIYECALRAGTPITYLDCEEGSFSTQFDGVDFETGSVLLLVHQYGIPTDPIKARQIASRFGLVLVEDVAPALGARWNGQPVGSFGDAAVLSFEYSKTISACKGGAVVYAKSELADRVRQCIENEHENTQGQAGIIWTRDALRGLLYEFALMPLVYGTLTLPLFRARNGGYVDRSRTVELGGPYQISFGARRACLTVNMLQRLPEIIEGRRRVFDVYHRVLADVTEIMLAPLPPEAEPVCTHFPLVLLQGKRNMIVDQLWADSIDPGFNFSYLCGGEGAARSAPVARGYTENILTLPISSRIDDGHAHRIAETLRKLVCKA